jgi:cyclic pyranopterin phosphate synthase
MAKLTHLDERGSAHMVEVGHKSVTQRRAVAQGALVVSPDTLRLIREGSTPKGDVLATARIAGIMAAKETSRLIPLCHPIIITGVHVNLTMNDAHSRIEVEASVDALDRTGVEMEALTAVSIATLTLYDMLKAVDHEMCISETRLIHKSGGKQDHPRSAQLASSTHESKSWRPIKVIGKSPTPTASIAQGTGAGLTKTERSELSAHLSSGEDVEVANFGELADAYDDHDHFGIELSNGVLTSTKPLIQLLTPTEPIPAINQPEGINPSSSEDDNVEFDEYASVWDESILAGVHEVDEEPLSRPEITEPLALKVKEVSLSYPPLRRFIVDRPVECAYLLGYLSPEYSQRSRAFILEEEINTTTDDDVEAHPTRIRSLLFIYSGLTLPTVWTYGSDLDIEAILRAVYQDLPRRIYLNIEDHHVGAVRAFYSLRHRRALLRMGLHRDHYKAVGETDGVISLSHSDTGSMMALFQRYYPDHLFEPAQLDLGLYCGIKSESELVSVAGLHLLNPEYRVAAIGNIVTDQAFRGLGYASQCVQHILDQLFESIDYVALNVAEGNEPAIHCYRKFGFLTTARLIEAQGRLR